MKYYKDNNNRVYAYVVDGSQDTYIKPDLMPITEAEADELRKPRPPSPEELQRQYLSAVDARMTVIANTRGYGSIESAAKYIGNTRNGTWAAEGEALRDWAIDVYESCHVLLAQVMAGEIPMPSIDELFGMLPEMAWPDGEAVPMKETHAQA